MPIVSLTRKDRQILQDVIRLVNDRPRNQTGRPAVVIDSPYIDANATPATYVARTPTGGIPAITFVSGQTGTGPPVDVLGAYCQVYQVDNINGILRPVPENKVFVYNLSSQVISGNKWILVEQDKYGSWIAIGGVGGGGGGGTPGDMAGDGACQFAHLRPDDCLAISYYTIELGLQVIYLTYEAGHWTSVDVFFYDNGSGTFDFYYESGRFHLKLAGLELIDCGGGCFTGSWITGHGFAETGTDTVEILPCNGSSFTVCVACSCCPIDGWEGEGWYCARDTYPAGTYISTGSGTGTGAADCVAVELLEEDMCDEDITICSGPYATEAEAQAVCDPVTPTAPCQNQNFATATAAFSLQTGDCTCLPSTPTTSAGGLDALTITTASCPGNISLTLSCSGGFYVLTTGTGGIVTAVASFSAEPPLVLAFDISGYGANCGGAGGTARLTITLP